MYPVKSSFELVTIKASDNLSGKSITGSTKNVKIDDDYILAFDKFQELYLAKIKDIEKEAPTAFEV